MISCRSSLRPVATCCIGYSRPINEFFDLRSPVPAQLRVILSNYKDLRSTLFASDVFYDHWQKYHSVLLRRRLAVVDTVASRLGCRDRRAKRFGLSSGFDRNVAVTLATYSTSWYIWGSRHL